MNKAKEANENLSVNSRTSFKRLFNKNNSMNNIKQTALDKNKTSKDRFIYSARDLEIADTKITNKKINYLSTPISPRNLDNKRKVQGKDNKNKANKSNINSSRVESLNTSVQMKELLQINNTKLNLGKSKNHTTANSPYKNLINMEKQDKLNKKFGSNKMRQNLISNTSSKGGSNFDNFKITMSKAPSKSFLITKKINKQANTDNVKFNYSTANSKKQGI